MMELKEIVQTRLKQLGLGPVEAATAAGLERTYIRDIVEGKKKSVRTDKLQALADALKIDAAALQRGELVASDNANESPSWSEFTDLFSKVSEDDQEAVLRLMRSLAAAKKE
ncbi:hypothetical protein DKP76_13500 [Falsochrobactrum shanghaiense]|uniref:HTH cro/C1-type domain-containing protein n=1 Tax=Falsochrobactrum shanghaiense TaxID=2201899 RepID=A0A316J5C3_9HYPH|nr:helix-turn-helix domain-containing protein [Falsochrobactrum shanghaiense]PWL17047.1 hypothetical protein DKP76_13500 [Falsochrobactrum shanghaiense]